VLTLHAQPLAARHEHVGMRALREHGCDLWRGLDDMLEVVEQEQHAPPVDELRQGPAPAKRPHCGRPNVGWVGERR
jgi:hypothetical protein